MKKKTTTKCIFFLFFLENLQFTFYDDCWRKCFLLLPDKINIMERSGASGSGVERLLHF